MQVGTWVRINWPDNPRVHNAEGIVKQSTDYGAIVTCGAAGSGEIRLLHSEMNPIDNQSTEINGLGYSKTNAKHMGYSGEICGNCQGMRTTRNGTCLKCEDCGQTTGCS